MFLGASLQDLGSVGPATLDLIDREVERLVGDAERAARSILRDNWSAVHETAHALLEHETLSGRRARRGPLDGGARDRPRRAPAAARREHGEAAGDAGATRAGGVAGARRPLAVAGALSAGAGAARPASWRLEQPAPPAGVAVQGAARRDPATSSSGRANRGLLAVEGNATIAARPLAYERRRAGTSSRPSAAARPTPTRIAWAGPDEFWVDQRAEPAADRRRPRPLPLQGRPVVVGSYSTAAEAAGPLPRDGRRRLQRPRTTAGSAASARRTRAAAGRRLPPALGRDEADAVYAPQGRGVSDMIATAAASTRRPSSARSARTGRRRSTLAEAEADADADPRRIAGGTLHQRRPSRRCPRPACRATGPSCWRPTATARNVVVRRRRRRLRARARRPTTAVARPPIAVRFADGFYQELPLDDGAVRRATTASSTSPRCRAASDAWATVAALRRARLSDGAGARRADLQPDGIGERRAAAGRRRRAAAPRRGSRSARPNEGWMVTNAGWLFHYTDGRAARRVDERPGLRAADHVPAQRGGRAVRSPTRRRPTTRSCSRRRRRVDPRPSPPRERSAERVKALMAKIRSKPQRRQAPAAAPRRHAASAREGRSCIAKRHGQGRRADAVHTARARPPRARAAARSADRWPDALRLQNGPSDAEGMRRRLGRRQRRDLDASRAPMIAPARDHGAARARDGRCSRRPLRRADVPPAGARPRRPADDDLWARRPPAAPGGDVGLPAAAARRRRRCRLDGRARLRARSPHPARRAAARVRAHDRRQRRLAGRADARRRAGQPVPRAAAERGLGARSPRTAAACSSAATATAPAGSQHGRAGARPGCRRRRFAPLPAPPRGSSLPRGEGERRPRRWPATRAPAPSRSPPTTTATHTQGCSSAVGAPVAGRGRALGRQRPGPASRSRCRRPRTPVPRRRARRRPPAATPTCSPRADPTTRPTGSSCSRATRRRRGGPRWVQRSLGSALFAAAEHARQGVAVAAPLDGGASSR